MEFLPLLTTIFGIAMSIGYFPQAYKIFKRKSAKDISLITYLLFTSGIIVWSIYGFSIKNLPIMISNLVAFVGSLSVIITYFIYK